MNATVQEAQVLGYVPLVENVVDKVRRTLPSHTDQEGLFGAGVEGLMHALQRFDPSKGVPFDAYARLRIRGAVQDELRTYDHLTRGQRQRATGASLARAVLQRDGHRATDAEVADAAGLPVEDVRLADLHSAPPVAWTTSPLQDNATCTPWQCPGNAEDRLNTQQELARLGDALVDLPARQQTAVGLYYGQDLTLFEVGEVLEVSVSRVSQILSSARGALKERLVD